MKTRALLSLFIIFLFSVNIFAAEPETIKYSNIEETTEGCVKEILYCDKETNAPLNKTVYNYDADGRMLEKASYNWDGTKGWVGTQKLVYDYHQDDQPTTPHIVKWDNKTNDWSTKD